MSDITDYMDNDVLHTIKQLSSNKTRLNIFSEGQFRFMICSEVTKDILANTEKYQYFSNCLELLGSKVSDYASSRLGVLLDKVVDALKARMDVSDKVRKVSGDDKEFND